METIKQGLQETAKIHKVLFDTMKCKNISFKVSDYSDKYFSKIYIDVYNYTKVYGSKFDGMQIIFEAGVYEVSEFQAGVNKNELHIYKETTSFKIAFLRRINNKSISTYLKQKITA